MTKDELIEMLMHVVPTYLDEDPEGRGFVCAVCEERDTKLFLGGENLPQLLGAVLGIVKQISSASDCSVEEVLQLLEEMIKNDTHIS